MKYNFEILEITRKNILSLVKSLSLEELNTIPENFNNNIAWNLGHVLVTQQLLNYRLSGNKCHLSDSLIDQYRKGTKPGRAITQDGLDYLSEELLGMIDLLKTDYEAGLFKSYDKYETSYNTTLASIEDAIVFNNVHEGLHYGYMMALKKRILSM